MQVCEKTAPNCAIVEGESLGLGELLGMSWREVIYDWVGSYELCGPATMPVSIADRFIGLLEVNESLPERNE